MRQLWRRFWADVARGQPEATVLALYGTGLAVCLFAGGLLLGLLWVLGR